MEKLIIVGAGPAGIAAALYAARANMNPLVINSGIGALEKAEKIENYYGLERPLSGKELFETFELVGVAENNEVMQSLREEIFEIKHRAVVVKVKASALSANILAGIASKSIPDLREIYKDKTLHLLQNVILFEICLYLSSGFYIKF